MDTNLKHVFDTAAGTLCITDTDGVIVYVNNVIEQQTGFAKAQAIGSKPGRLWGGQMSHEYYENLWETIKKRRMPFVSGIKNRKNDGTFITETAHIAPVIRQDNTVAYYVEIRPAVSSDSFSSEFISRFQAMAAGSQYSITIGMLGDWLSTGSLVGVSEPFCDALEQTLIIPTQEQFSERGRDSILISLAQQNPRYYGEVFEKYHDDIYRYFNRRVSSVEIAADLTQDVFVRAYEALHSFVPSNASYRTYLLRIAHNALANYYRKKKTVPLEDSYCLIDSVPESNDETYLLWERAGELSKIEQTVLELKYKMDWSVQEIAAHLNKTENAVKLYLSRSRQKLRTLLED